MLKKNNKLFINGNTISLQTVIYKIFFTIQPIVIYFYNLILILA